MIQEAYWNRQYLNYSVYKGWIYLYVPVECVYTCVLTLCNINNYLFTYSTLLHIHIDSVPHVQYTSQVPMEYGDPM